jgi:phenylpropionate dioxygenase-like ring-hydroxylating dioxygenase large terminal subunit
MASYANGEFVMNAWYPIATEAEVDEAARAGKPLERYVIGQRLCVFKDADGNIGILNDVCPHMGAKLSAGLVVNGCVQCKYHDQLYDHTGRCTHIPSLAAGGKIPDTMQTDSYAVQVRYGIVWVFMGDEPDGENQPPLIAVPEFTDSAFNLMKRYRFTWRCSVRVAIENLLDSSHFCHAHKGTFGNAKAPLTVPPEIVDRGSWSVRGKVGMLFSEQSPMFSEAQEAYGPNPEVTVDTQFLLPATIVIRFELNKPGRKRWCDVEMFAISPGREDEVNFFWVEMSTRNQTEEDPTTMSEGAREFLEEDEVIVRSCSPELLPTGGVPVKVDRFVLASRALYDAYLKENGVGPYIYNTRSGGEAVVVPSPVRTSNEAFGEAWKTKD